MDLIEIDKLERENLELKQTIKQLRENNGIAEYENKIRMLQSENEQLKEKISKMSERMYQNVDQ